MNSTKNHFIITTSFYGNNNIYHDLHFPYLYKTGIVCLLNSNTKHMVI